MAEATLPTEKEIRQLPRWARVAFAARCARRALPLFVKHWPNAPRHHVEAITNAVEVAESAAGTASEAAQIDSAFAAADAEADAYYYANAAANTACGRCRRLRADRQGT